MSLEPREPDEVAQAIAGRIYSKIPDGATLQLGIGAVPGRCSLSDRSPGDWIWSEMFSDGCFSGRVGLFRHRRAAHRVVRQPAASGCTTGSTETAGCGCADRNDQQPGSDQPHPVDDQRQLRTAGRPLRSGERLTHQGPDLPGFGGSTDFIVGARTRRSNHAFIALPSWHPRATSPHDRALIEGPVTSFQHS